MIVCNECGHHNEDGDTFCGSCGAFLEWAGERIAPAVVPEPEPVPPVPPVPPGPPAPPPPVSTPIAEFTLPAPVVHVDEGESAKQAQLAAMVGTPVASEPAPDRRSPSAPQPPATGAPQPTGERQPSAVQPAPPKRRRPPKTGPGPTKVLKPGDLVCGQCGEGNDPARRFCRRCGASLAEAVVVKSSWWRRLRNRFKRRKVQAGERPGRVRRKAKVKTGRLRSVVAVLLFLGAVAFLVGVVFRDPIVDLIDSVRDRFSDPEMVRPVAAEASSAQPDHPAEMAIDNHGNTYWATAGDGVGQSLTLRFDRPVDLDHIVITPGANAEKGDFVQHARPREVLVNVDSGATSTLHLADSGKAQTFGFEAKAVTVVQLVIQSVYQGLAASDCAIALVEFTGSG